MSTNDDPKATGPAQTPPPSRLSPGTPGASAGREPGASTAGAPGQTSGDQAGAPAPAGTRTAEKQDDPLRGSRASGFWATVIVLVVVLILLAVFVLQNTQPVEVSFFGWTGNPPLAAAMMIAAALGLVIAVAAGTLRILQLRRRVKRVRKGDK